ncbi:MAG: hypothetical protein K2X94_02635 [Amoebophilaceae bacterium]|nr:hypothetical protein [Amoebophilaceae bacterium]
MYIFLVLFKGYTLCNKCKKSIRHAYGWSCFFYGLKAPPKEQWSYSFLMLASPDKSILSELKTLFHQVKNNTLVTQVEISYIASCHTLQKSQFIFVKSFFRLVRDRGVL